MRRLDISTWYLWFQSEYIFAILFFRVLFRVSFDATRYIIFLKHLEARTTLFSMFVNVILHGP